MLNFPNSPNDGDQSQQPNGVTYQWNAADTRWEAVLGAGGASVISTGMVAAFAVGAVDAGWLLCDGAPVSRSTYAVLFNAIGESYGNGDGSTTFNLPDYRGQFLRGQDAGAGTDPDAAGRTDRGDGTTGDNVGTKQADDFASHDHVQHAGQLSNLGSQGRNADGADNGPTSIITSLTGGNETRPVNIYVQYFIYTGLNLVAGGLPLSGSVVQMHNFQDGAFATGTNLFVVTNAKPINTDGDEYLSTAFTPKFADSMLRIDVVCYLSTSGSNRPYLNMALFQDAIVDAIAGGNSRAGSDSDEGQIVVNTFFVAAESLDERTYKVRAGSHQAGTTALNGPSNGTGNMGGVMRSSITVTEIAA